MTFPVLVTKILWIFPLVVQAALAIGMIRRRLLAIFPLFFAYTATVLFGETILLYLTTSSDHYARLFWYKEALAVVLSLAVVFEILGTILPSSFSLKVVVNSVWILAAIAAVVAFVMLTFAKPATGSDPMYELIVLAERSIRFLQACLLIIVIALMSRLGLTWRDQSVGIAAGFGIYSALALVSFEFGANLHWIGRPSMALINSGAYNLATMIWAFYILRPLRVTPVEHLPESDLTEWNTAVNDYVNQWSRHS
jgi:hypothetical protein